MRPRRSRRSAPTSSSPRAGPRTCRARTGSPTPVLADVDRTCSRFREDSDLTRANATPAPGSRSTRCSSLPSRPPARRRRADRRHGPPAARAALAQLGYDRDFARAPGRRPTLATARPADTAGPDAWREIDLDHDGAIRVPAGTALDLGATAKAWAADIIAAAVARDLGAGASSASAATSRSRTPGRPASRGRSRSRPSPGARPRPRSPRPRRPRHLEHPRYAAGRARGVQLHHVLDPRTGLPSATVWQTVTATGRVRPPPTPPRRRRSCSGAGSPPGSREHGVDATAGRRRRPRRDHRQLARRATTTRRQERCMTPDRLGHRLPVLWYLNRGTGFVDPRPVHIHRRPRGAVRRPRRARGLPRSSPRRCTATSPCCRWSLLAAHVITAVATVRRHPLVAGLRAVRRLDVHAALARPRHARRSTCSSWSRLTSLHPRRGCATAGGGRSTCSPTSAGSSAWPTASGSAPTSGRPRPGPTPIVAASVGVVGAAAVVRARAPRPADGIARGGVA